jgi:hypothetical protein
MTTESGITKITKRFVVSVLSAGLIYWSLKVHRNWVWAYFESIMLYQGDSAALSNVATASISALTTAFIAGSSSIAFIVAFFITGNVAALRGMFQWGNVAQTIGSVSASSENVAQTIDEKVDEKIVRDYQQRYSGDPSYRPVQIDVEETFR